MDSLVCEGDVVHVQAPFTDGHARISDSAGLLVVNPDLLISGTTVVSACFCMRKYGHPGVYSIYIVSESDILGPIDCFSDIEILVSFERVMLADYSLRNKIKIIPFLMSISPL